LIGTEFLQQSVEQECSTNPVEGNNTAFQYSPLKGGESEQLGRCVRKEFAAAKLPSPPKQRDGWHFGVVLV
jgi:hypothetical protein